MCFVTEIYYANVCFFSADQQKHNADWRLKNTDWKYSFCAPATIKTYSCNWAAVAILK